MLISTVLMLFLKSLTNVHVLKPYIAAGAGTASMQTGGGTADDAMNDANAACDLLGISKAGAASNDLLVNRRRFGLISMSMRTC